MRRVALTAALFLAAIPSVLLAQTTPDVHPGDWLRVVATCEAIPGGLSCGSPRGVTGKLVSITGDTVVLDQGGGNERRFLLGSVTRIDRVTGPASATARGTAPLLQPQDQVRVKYQQASDHCGGRPLEVRCGRTDRWVTGALVTVTADSLVIQSDSVSQLVSVPRQAVTRLYRARRGSAAAALGGVGVLIGGIAGVATANGSTCPSFDVSCAAGVGLAGMLLGGVVGGVLGASIGSLISVQEWEDVKLAPPTPAGASRAARSVRLGLSIAL